MRKQRSRIFFALIIPVFAVFSVFSCSINYNTAIASDTSETPEFVFYKTELTRVEKGDVSVRMTADTLEQYTEENVLYGTNLTFSVFNNDKEKSAAGSSDLFMVNSDTEKYYLLNNAVITSYDQDMQIRSDSIMWDGQTEQLVTSDDLPVRIASGGFSNPKGGTSSPENASQTLVDITGNTFSVDGTSNSFVFGGSVSGTILTQDDKQ